MQSGDRVLYVPPIGASRWGVLRAVSGQSAEILFDGCAWPQWAPLGRLYAATPSAAGWLQLAMVAEGVTEGAS